MKTPYTDVEGEKCVFVVGRELHDGHGEEGVEGLGSRIPVFLAAPAMATVHNDPPPADVMLRHHMRRCAFPGPEGELVLTRDKTRRRVARRIAMRVRD
jgi:hypothetical protein